MGRRYNMIFITSTNVEAGLCMDNGVLLYSIFYTSWPRFINSQVLMYDY